ncbi:MAG TPA: C13 family peptidase [Pseudorhodoplanes sp.]|jgi:hypothetical protein|nr:C13 family peptidase [Pseudorhodoplanes sp.]
MQKFRRSPVFQAALLAALAAILVLSAAAPARAQSEDPAIWVDFERIRAAQPALLEKQFAHLSKSQGDGGIYVVGVAGWSAQDVFIKELDGALASLSRVLPISSDRVVRLVNNVRTVDTIPIASPDNFKAAIGAVGRVMDKQKDTLILFMTSHGTPGGVVLKLGRAVAELSPRDVAETLEQEQIKNRVVIVSACYSGVYLKPLANEDTFVLTAADSFSPSFGCSAKRSWTYFGDAFFNQSLRPGTDFQTAFGKARKLIRKWEIAGKLNPSNPQAFFGGELSRRIDSLLKAMAHSRS